MRTYPNNGDGGAALNNGNAAMQGRKGLLKLLSFLMGWMVIVGMLVTCWTQGKRGSVSLTELPVHFSNGFALDRSVSGGPSSHIPSR